MLVDEMHTSFLRSRAFSITVLNKAAVLQHLISSSRVLRRTIDHSLSSLLLLSVLRSMDHDSLLYAAL